MNSQSIPGELWIEARTRLIFYFTRRRGIQNAEDLAQKTLLAIWVKNFEFEKQEDFLKVCYGFAKHILQEAYREEKNHEFVELDPEMEAKVLGTCGLKGAEAAVFLQEVRRNGEQKLHAEEWKFITAAINRDEHNPPVSGNVRLKVYRARKRLAQITGWKK